MKRITFEEAHTLKDELRRRLNVKTTIELKGGKVKFKCEPNDKIVLADNGDYRLATREEAIDYFFDCIRLGDNLEVEQGAYGLFDTLVGNTYVETELYFLIKNAE